MGLADCFSAEDRVQVKFSTFYELVKGCTQRDFRLCLNGSRSGQYSKSIKQRQF